VTGDITAADGPQQLFAAIDSKDTDTFLRFIRDDGVFRFGSVPGVQGHDAIREAVDGFFASIAGSRHSIKQSLREDGTMVFEGEVTYRRHNGSELTLPFANVFDLDGDLITTYKIYIDIGPLYAE
jgi:limonene-1,2-epoxide hydrolase